MTRNYPPLYILRHGETLWNVEGRFQGHLDSPLTDKGQAQARAQNTILRDALGDSPVDLLVSPAGRAQATATLALEGIEVAGRRHDDPRLLEIMMGDWQGYTRAEIAHHWPEAYRTAEAAAAALWQFHAPQGETLADMAGRCAAVLAELNGPTVIITHGITSRVLRSLVLGRDTTDLMALPGGQGNVHLLRDGRAEILT